MTGNSCQLLHCYVCCHQPSGMKMCVSPCPSQNEMVVDVVDWGQPEVNLPKAPSNLDSALQEGGY